MSEKKEVTISNEEFNEGASRIEGTPFTVVKIHNKWRLTIGNMVINNVDYESKEDVIKAVTDMNVNWDIMLGSLCAIAQMVKKGEDNE